MEIIKSSLFNHARLQANYRFNSGALTTDSKNSFTLTNTNSVAEIATGKFGYGADFSSNNTNKNLARSGAMGSNGERTILFWGARWGELTSGIDEMVQFQHQGNHAQYQLRYYESGGNNYLTVGRHYPAVDLSYGTPYQFSLGTDYHLFAFERSNTNSTLKLWLDGEQTTPVINWSVGGGGLAATDAFIMGSGWDSQPASFIIDDVGVFDALLTADERLQSWKNVQAGLPMIFGGGVTVS